MQRNTSNTAAVSLRSIVERFGGQVQGANHVEVKRVASLRSARQGDLAYCGKPKFLSDLNQSQASAAIVTAELAQAYQGAARTNLIIHDQPRRCFSQVAQWLHPYCAPPPAIDPHAQVKSHLPASAYVGAHASVGQNVQCGQRVYIGANVVIGDDVIIGDDCRIMPHVVVYSGSQLGNAVVIHAGTVIGSDGFGYERDQDAWLEVPQLGSVRLADGVRVGANCTIDCGALDDTVIAEGVKIDDQVHIAHNCSIGKNTIIAGKTALAGSVVIGAQCVLAGHVVIRDYVTIGDGAVVHYCSTVSKNLPGGAVYSSTPFSAQPHKKWLRLLAKINRLNRDG